MFFLDEVFEKTDWLLKTFIFVLFPSENYLPFVVFFYGLIFFIVISTAFITFFMLGPCRNVGIEKHQD